MATLSLDFVRRTSLFEARTKEDNLTFFDPRLVFVAAASAPDELTLATSWGQGIYAFLAETVGDEAGFAEALRQLLETTGARIVWLANPNDRREQWRFTALRLMNVTPTGGTTAAPAVIPFGNLSITLPQGTNLSVSPDGFRFAPENVRFLARHGRLELPVITGPVRIGFEPGAAGALQFPMKLAGAHIDQLDIGCRFYYPGFQIGQSDVLAGLRYRLFDPQGAQLLLDAVIDPLFPTDAERTNFTFQVASPALPSFLRSGVGRPISLKPLPGSRLLLTPRNTGVAATRHDPLTLVPDGPFEFTSPTLLCGTSGSEFIETPQTALMLFQAGRPAYARDFDRTPPPDKLSSLVSRLTGLAKPEDQVELAFDLVNNRKPTAKERTAALDQIRRRGLANFARTLLAEAGGGVPVLEGSATTAWARITSAAARLRYSSVPEDSGYYQLQAGTSLRPYYPACAAFLPFTSEAAAAEGYPLVPYAGVSRTNASVASRLEAKVLMPQRRELIRRLNRLQPGAPPTSPAKLNNLAAVAQPLAAAAGAPIETMSPQGMLAQFSADGTTWSHLTLGRSEAGALAFQTVTEPLRSALLTKQQFIVISDPEKIKEIFKADKDAAKTETDVRLEGWDIDLAPSNWDRFGTILIIKNEDRPLQDMARDTDRWTQGRHFNQSVSGTAERLLALIAEARERRKNNEDFAYFVETVAADPDWNGVLFLNAALVPGGLPKDLDGFAAGIERTRFFAHHIGINQTPMEDNPLQPENSSFFGLIDYDEPPNRAARPGDFDFSVRRLRVLFRNSKMANFTCKVALTINRFLGAGVTGNTRTLELDGSYEKHGDSHALALKQAGPVQLGLADTVLARATIERTHFTTRLPAIGSTDKVEARFSLWGTFHFNQFTVPDEAQKFDLFSYDGLKYAQLAIQMEFPADKPEQVTFALNATEVSVTASGARPGSLAQRFPMKLKGFLSSFASSKPPNKLGYATVGLPVKRDKLNEIWCGLSYDLSLGTLGELAGNAGITAELALLWSPDPSGNRILAGLKIPGLTGSGAGFSLMGLLRMKMHSLDLVQTEGAYQLLLNGITLNLFGKSLPPGASFDFFIFGSDTPDSLGWYGSYKKTP